MNAPSASHAHAAAAWNIRPQGDRCLIVSFGQVIDAQIGRTCLAAARTLRQAGLPGVTDVVPSFVAVAVHYRPVSAQGPAFDELARRVDALLRQGIAQEHASGRDIEIPVCYGGEHGPDLDEVARASDLTPAQVIALHSGAPSLVFMLGFAPGHAYLGIHDERLDLPRRDSPRTVVPAGSIAVANRQTVIYPSRLPGGWSLIGATPLKMFDPAREPAALLQPGDIVRFVPIGAGEFARLREAAT